MNPTQAIHNRDPDALDRAFDNLQEAEAFRNEVLPSLSPADCKWFWQQTMTPEQLSRTLNAVRDVCLSVATGVGLKLNEDFTAAVDIHGDPILIAKPEVQRIFYAALPTQRHSILRFYLQEPMA
jgi:hypothetical protein